jgi:hypothetical protein
VKRAHQLIGVSGDDGAALKWTIFAMPRFSESGEREAAAIPKRDVVGF